MTPTVSEVAMLFVPGTAEDKFKVVDRWPGRSFILDLEDSVPPPEKAAARTVVAALLDRAGGGATLHVRVNPASSEHIALDIDAVVRPGLAGIVLPKVEHPDDLVRADRLIGSAERRAGLPTGGVAVQATIETAAGLHAVHDIAAASVRLSRLAFGSGDFARDLGLDWPDERGTGPTLLVAKAQLVLASRVARLLPPHDGAHARYRDLDGLRREAKEARRLGFGGKHVIHPDQIPVVEEAFRPSPTQLERARRLVAAFEEAEADGRAAVGVDGELVDYAIVLRARQVLAEAGTD